MKSGLWILIVVIIAGIAVGYVFKDRMKPPEPGDAQAELKEIADLTDSEAKIDRLVGLHLRLPDERPQVPGLLDDCQGDAGRRQGHHQVRRLRRQTIEKETDAESKALMYYRLYNIKIDTKPEEAALIGTELLKVPIDAAWVYNYVGYDLAERGRDLDLAMSLCPEVGRARPRPARTARRAWTAGASSTTRRECTRKRSPTSRSRSSSTESPSKTG